VLCPAELRDRWSRYNHIKMGTQKVMRNLHVSFTGKNCQFLNNNFKCLRARAVLGNRCSIRLSYGTS
jgi:hypothetical protein